MSTPSTLTLSRDFYTTVFARFAMSFSVELQATLMGWQMYELTRDPFQLALVGLAEAVPALSLALFAGYLVDRGNPHRIYFTVMFVSVVSLFIAWFAKTPNTLFISAILSGLVRGFAAPAIQTIIPRLVEKDQLKQANTWTTGANKCATIAGPALGGALLAWKGHTLPYALGFGVLSCAVLAFATVRVPKPKLVRVANARAEKAPFLSELFVGFRFVFGERLLIASLALDMFAVLFGGVTAILPVFAREILNLGPSGLGILRASPAIGATVMTIVLIRRPFIRSEGKTLFWVVCGFGLSTLAFALSRNLYLCAGFLALGGALDSISMVIRGALVQTLSPEALRGRIAAVNSLFIGSSNELGAFESGTAASLLGLMPSIYFGGMMTLVTAMVVYGVTPGLYRFTLRKLTDRTRP